MSEPLFYFAMCMKMFKLHFMFDLNLLSIFFSNFHSSQRHAALEKKKRELQVVYKPSGHHSRRKKLDWNIQKQVLNNLYSNIFSLVFLPFWSWLHRLLCMSRNIYIWIFFSIVLTLTKSNMYKSDNHCLQPELGHITT